MTEGDYVRTKHGIEKITDIKEWVNFRGYEKIITTDKNQYETLYEQSEIIKSSPNIIDLIEVGDLIRIEYYSLRYEERVTRLFEVTFKDKKYINLNNSKCDFMLIDGDFNKSDKELEPIIKSIVTKEQFSCMEYTIGD